MTKYELLAMRVFARTRFMQVMKYCVINYWGPHNKYIDKPALIESVDPKYKVK